MLLKNDRLLKALMRQPVDCTPIWIMRQAGRYLPEYRATRQKAGSFVKLCKTPELACEVTLQPLDRYALDAGIIFSDILTIPDAMGLELEMIENIGPTFKKPLHRIEDMEKLVIPDPEQLNYVYDAIRLVKHELNGRVPLIGFCGSPWTLACYMIEGRSKNGFPRIQQLMQENPRALHQLLETLARSVASHLNGQIQAGADVVMIFDTWGGMLATEDYMQYSLAPIQLAMQLLERQYNNKKIPVILFTKGGHHWLEQMSDSTPDALAVDWQISLREARERVGAKVAIQGNLNPSVLLASGDVIKQEAARVLNEFGAGSGHVFNLGHGITPDVPPENVAILIDAVHELSKQYHR